MPIYQFANITPVVDRSAYVHPQAVLIGDVIIERNCYVGPNASLRGDFGRIIMHAGANIQDNCVMHSFPGHDAVIEENGHVGHGAVLHGCVIRRDALIGMNSVVMDAAEIGEGAFVGAMTFVRAGFVVPPRMLALGAPARIVRPLRAEELDWKANGSRQYQALAKMSLDSLLPCSARTEIEPDRQRSDAFSATPLHILEQ